MFTFSCIFVIYCTVWFVSSNAANYSSRLDAIDLDEILRSDRLLKNYFECLMGRGPCTSEGSELKRIIPDALKSECDKCSDTQKKKAAKAIKFLQKNKPSMYKALKEKYDPEDIYRAKLEKNLENF